MTTPILGGSIIVVREENKYAIDYTLPYVRTRFKKLTGKFPSKNASIIAFTGSLEDIDKVGVNDFGEIVFPKSLTKINLQ